MKSTDECEICSKRPQAAPVDADHLVDSRPFGRPEITLQRFRVPEPKNPKVSEVEGADRADPEAWLTPLLAVIATTLKWLEPRHSCRRGMPVATQQASHRTQATQKDD